MGKEGREVGGEGREAGVEGAGRGGIGGGKSVTIWVRNCFCLIKAHRKLPKTIPLKLYKTYGAYKKT